MTGQKKQIKHVVGFKKQFAPMVKAELKNQTIRKERKRPIKPGDILRMYTGPYKPGKRIFLREAVCQSVQPIRINTDESVVLDGKELNGEAAFKLAQDDGFPLTEKFVDFFRQNYGLPFEGVLIRW
ncbi:hypothetical protein [Desulfatibacillum aliphaticivorans]|uniref:hypothetical protein n=1 Tax=Desulfatibacillum aliphaticivorans TaxID=218208 RepID=UPI00041FFDAD|nr:hypothetical protein [Desulfatibacillum aliphaticivorans]